MFQYDGDRLEFDEPIYFIHPVMISLSLALSPTNSIAFVGSPTPDISLGLCSALAYLFSKLDLEITLKIAAFTNIEIKFD